MEKRGSRDLLCMGGAEWEASEAPKDEQDRKVSKGFVLGRTWLGS